MTEAKATEMGNSEHKDASFRVTGIGKGISKQYSQDQGTQRFLILMFSVQI